MHHILQQDILRDGIYGVTQNTAAILVFKWGLGGRALDCILCRLLPAHKSLRCAGQWGL